MNERCVYTDRQTDRRLVSQIIRYHSDMSSAKYESISVRFDRVHTINGFYFCLDLFRKTDVVEVVSDDKTQFIQVIRPLLVELVC